MRRRPPLPALAVAVAAGGLEPSAVALEAPDDLATDHVVAAGDGPGSLSLAARPVSLQWGVVGAELAAAASPRAALTLEADWRATSPGRMQGASLGLALFPASPVFRGLYVHPMVEVWRACDGGGLRGAVGAGAVLGYQWTAPWGASLRLGGGLGYRAWTGAVPTVVALGGASGVVPELDAALLWVL